MTDQVSELLISYSSYRVISHCLLRMNHDLKQFYFLGFSECN